MRLVSCPIDEKRRKKRGGGEHPKRNEKRKRGYETVVSLPMADGPHKAFGTAHVPRIGVGEDLSDSCDGFAASGDGNDGGNLRGLPGTNDLVDPEHVISDEVGGFLNRSLVRQRKRFLWGGKIDAMRTLRVEEEKVSLTDTAAKP